MAQPYSPEDAKRKIALILREGTFEISLHAKKRMRERNVTDQDILHVLETGEIVRKPEWDEERNHWKYRMEGVDLDGDSLTAITVIFDFDMSLLVVTIFE